jgi:hypothetical protein
MKLAEVVLEAWMAKRLGLPIGWDGGVTTRAKRSQTIREAILRGDLGDVLAGHRRGHSETWARLFERGYSEPLQPKEL